MKAADLAELPIIGMPQDANAYHSIINWFEEAEVSPGLMHCLQQLQCGGSAGAAGRGCQSAAAGSFRWRPRVRRLEDIRRTA